MKSKDLTCDIIKELADMAVNSGRNFSLGIDVDGYISIDVSVPNGQNINMRKEK